MNLDDVGNIAELISAIGVVATLAYLSIQIRQSSVTNRAIIRQQLASQQIDYLSQRTTNPDLRSAIFKRRNGEPLSVAEVEVLDAWAHAGLRLFESCHAQWEYGTLSDDDWNAIRRRYAISFQSGLFRDNFEQAPYDIWNPRFAKVVQLILQSDRAA